MNARLRARPRSKAERSREAVPLVWGHRGTRSSASKPGPTENTLAALRYALDQGADGVELDVRACGSGEIVVLHDVDLQRVAGVALRAEDATLEQLQAHDLGRGERVPLLAAAIDLVLDYGARDKLLNVEIKSDVPDPIALARAVAQCIAARAGEEQARIVVSSFSAPICEAVHAALPSVAVAFLFERTEHAAVLPRGIAAVHPHHALLDAALVQRFRALELVVNTWTVNDPERAQALAALGLDGIITDDVPPILRRFAEK